MELGQAVLSRMQWKGERTDEPISANELWYAARGVEFH